MGGYFMVDELVRVSVAEAAKLLFHVGADEVHRLMEVLQKTTDRHVADIDRLGAVKEREVLEV